MTHQPQESTKLTYGQNQTPDHADAQRSPQKHERKPKMGQASPVHGSEMRGIVDYAVMLGPSKTRSCTQDDASTRD
jgi:hypothetical protein